MKRAFIEGLVKMAVIAGVMALALPDLSWASDFGQTVDKTKTNLTNAPTIVSAIAYIVGGATMLSGAASLKKHADTPQQEPLQKGVMRLGVGATVAALPPLMGWVQNSLSQGSDPFNFKGLSPIQ